MRPLLLLAALAAVGCGHPASREECSELWAKNAELALRTGPHPQTDPKVIADQVAQKRAVEGEEFVKRCEGKRITKRALDCVLHATTPEQADRCL
jgi:hypothetical protein